MKYNDPSGEFLHLIIGAVIGGVVNWAANGADFSWKGLAHFGVGAAAGALGAGVGGGVSSALAGKSFAAGFLGTSAAGAVGSSFMSGSLIGASAGFSTGFTSGFGNALVDGASFGSALGSGFRDGALAGLSGGIMGGMVGGIDAASDGRNFWTGEGFGKTEFMYGSGGNGELYRTTDEMRADFNNNMTSGNNLDQIEKKLATSVTLEGSNLDDNGFIMTSKGPAYASTTPYHTGGFGSRQTSFIKIAPGVKGLSLIERNLTFKHELIHAWHLSRGISSSHFNLYSERVTAAFEFSYRRTFNLAIPSHLWSDLGRYPKQYNWRLLNRIVPLWPK